VPEKVISDAITISKSWRRLTPTARDLFLPVLVRTDKWGRHDGDLDKLRLSCIPEWPNWPDERMLSALEELVREDMIELYCVEGRWYLSVVNHDRYQHPSVHLRKGESRHPPPPDRSTIDRRSFDEFLLYTRERATRGNGGVALQAFDISYSDSALRDHAVAVRDREQGETETWKTGSLGASLEPFHRLACRLPDADERTPVVLASVAAGLSEARLAEAWEQLEKRRGRPPRLKSQTRYLVATLKRMRDEADNDGVEEGAA